MDHSRTLQQMYVMYAYFLSKREVSRGQEVKFASFTVVFCCHCDPLLDAQSKISEDLMSKYMYV